MPYYTQCVDDANNLPTILGSPNFFGIGLLDSDPYLPYAVSWSQNQNNFWRHVRKFVLDMTQMPTSGGYHGVHWQVAQGTLLQNIVINMAENVPNNTQIVCVIKNKRLRSTKHDNRASLWTMVLEACLIFNGGGIGLFTGNQQWTARNLTFNNCGTAIFQNWNWVFNYKSITINDCDIGIDMTQGANVPATVSIVLLDSVMNNVATAGILTSFNTRSTPVSAAALVLDTVDFVNTPVGIMSSINQTVLLEGNSLGNSYVQGRAYSAFESQQQVGNLTRYEPAATGARVQTTAIPPPKPASLLTPTGTIYERSKPQYEGVPVESFVSILDYGCIGDGVTDTTQCVRTISIPSLPIRSPLSTTERTSSRTPSIFLCR